MALCLGLSGWAGTSTSTGSPGCAWAQSTTINSILPVQFMCFTVFCTGFFWSSSWPGTSTSYSIHFFTKPLSSFRTHAHTIAACFAAVLRFCHLILVSLSTLYLELYFFNFMPHIHLTILIFASCSVTSFFCRPGLMSVQHTTSHTTPVQSACHYIHIHTYI